MDTKQIKGATMLNENTFEKLPPNEELSGKVTKLGNKEETTLSEEEMMYEEFLLIKEIEEEEDEEDYILWVERGATSPVGRVLSPPIQISTKTCKCKVCEPFGKDEFCTQEFLLIGDEVKKDRRKYDLKEKFRQAAFVFQMSQMKDEFYERVNKKPEKRKGAIPFTLCDMMVEYEKFLRLVEKDEEARDIAEEFKMTPRFKQAERSNRKKGKVSRPTPKTASKKIITERRNAHRKRVRDEKRSKEEERAAIFSLNPSKKDKNIIVKQIRVYQEGYDEEEEKMRQDEVVRILKSQRDKGFKAIKNITSPTCDKDLVEEENDDQLLDLARIKNLTQKTGVTSSKAKSHVRKGRKGEKKEGKREGEKKKAESEKRDITKEIFTQDCGCKFKERCIFVVRKGGKWENKKGGVGKICKFTHPGESVEEMNSRILSSPNSGLCTFLGRCKNVEKINGVWSNKGGRVCTRMHPGESAESLEERLKMTRSGDFCAFSNKCRNVEKVNGVWVNKKGGKICPKIHPGETEEQNKKRLVCKFGKRCRSIETCRFSH